MATTEASTARLNDQGQITLPAAILEAAHVPTDAEFSVDVLPDGAIVLRPLRDPEQWWFWTEAWQAGERRADEDLAAGRFRRFHSDEAFLQSLGADEASLRSADGLGDRDDADI